jgi:hypothetical protein
MHDDMLGRAHYWPRAQDAHVGRAKGSDSLREIEILIAPSQTDRVFKELWEKP